MRTGLLKKSDQYRYVAEQRKEKTINRFRVFKWVCELQAPPGTSVNKTPIFVLATHYRSETGQCFPSIPTIMRESGMSRSPVIRALKQYVDFGWISRVKRGWHGRSTVYALHIHLNPIPVLSSMMATGGTPEGASLSPLGVSVPPTVRLQDPQRSSIKPINEVIQEILLLYRAGGITRNELWVKVGQAGIPNHQLFNGLFDFQTLYEGKQLTIIDNVWFWKP